jgi:hypothetical protein
MATLRIRGARAAVATAMLACAAGACTEETPCDDGQVLRGSYCYSMDAALPSQDADSEAGGAGEAGGAEPFGQTCTSSTDCVPPAIFCAPQPGRAFCTALGCDQDPSLCPPTWICMDLSSYSFPAYMCVPGT